MATLSPRPTIDADVLRARMRGRVVAPGDDDYEELRIVMDGGIDRRPAAIALVESTDDVRAVVAYARDTGAELALRSGGHSAAGHSTTEGGLVLDLRRMKNLDIDPETRTAWAETGLTAAEVTAAAAAQGLAIGFGDTGSVGIGGITTGGGIGYLVRKHGLTIDSVLAAEIVTADGDLLQVDAEHHRDLFWAIRGGGGNFGVITRFRFALQPVDGVLGGILVLPATADTVAGFMAAADAAPEELSTIANVMNCPPMPFVPEEHHGSLVILAMLCHVGDAEAGQQAMAPFRALAEPLADLVRPISYPEMYPPEDEGYHPVAVARTFFMDGVDRDEAAAIVDALAANDASLRAVQLRALGGAMARVAPDATAFAHRTSRVMAIVVSFVDAPEERDARTAWVDELVARLRPEGAGAYVNFLAEEGEARVREAYPGATWERLVAVKQRYDPTNLFRLNQNIRPAPA